ncbi:pyridoxamine 5'-phosphate oxidase family protein [Chamaesiphon sp. OTE_75_metabat_556]|uniref:pyridoxamine 5'-phosphate oxidase family protein n=1 Tax=Chamaesiphon sp. OTE_75_metabat_556 TaxID=2964692 RepID=UPI00286AF058|nr:pyridoxamine 5'-phosphate oxidase family protein [Chamaesiphon sp. OTE_75_metabat_556]
MLDIDEMSSTEIYELLNKIGYGHLGFIHAGKPYVMPMHYYLEHEDIYMFTTEGMKTHDIDASPEICLQVEEIINDPLHWRSVIVTGQANRLTEKSDIDRVRKSIKEINPTLSPALNRTWIDSWGRAEVVAIYRVNPSEMSGRTTDGVSSRQLIS